MLKRNRQAKPQINLDWKNKDMTKPKPIFLIYRYKFNLSSGKKEVFKFSTGKEIHPKSWDKKTQTAIKGVRVTEKIAVELNDFLYELKKEVKNIVFKNPDISKGDLKKELDYFTKKAKRPKPKDESNLLEHINRFIINSQNASRTISKYNGAKKLIENYEKHLGKSIEFNNLNSEFVREISSWYYKENPKNSQNTLAKNITIIGQIQTDAYDNGYSKSAKKKSFSLSRVPTTKVFLTWSEVKKLINCDLKIGSNFDKSRDLWVIAAMTGLRYGAFSDLNKRHFKVLDGVPVIQIIKRKGIKQNKNNTIIIPVMPELQAIFNKYNYKFPKPFESQVMSRHIKECLKKAEINREVEYTKNEGGKQKILFDPIYKLINNHSARFTFINILLNEFDLGVHEVKKITGQSLKVLLDYEQGNKKKNAIKVATKIAKAKLKMLDYEEE